MHESQTSGSFGWVQGGRDLLLLAHQRQRTESLQWTWTAVPRPESSATQTAQRMLRLTGAAVGSINMARQKSTLTTVESMMIILYSRVVEVIWGALSALVEPFMSDRVRSAITTSPAVYAPGHSDRVLTHISERRNRSE